MTGRLPVHLGEMNQESDGIDLRMKTLGDKLTTAGYSTELVGKTHWGVATDLHLPYNRGFQRHIGYLGGGEAYSSGYICTVETTNCDDYVKQLDMWHDDHPAEKEYMGHYSTDLYTQLAVAAIHNHSRSSISSTGAALEQGKPAKPLWLHLNYQAIHNPQTSPPGMPHYGDDTSLVLYQVLEAMSAGVASVTAALKDTGMYDNTLIVFVSDNGAADHGNNFPLRGGKYTPFEGGVRLAAAVSGGLVPENVRGTVLNEIVHISDVYPTLAGLAGVSGKDDPPSDSPKDWFWPVDGLDFWPSLTKRKPSAWTGKPLVISSPITSGAGGGALIVDNYKIVNNVANHGWDQPANTKSSAPTLKGNSTCLSGSGPNCIICSVEQPCLYDVIKDSGEVHNLASKKPDILKQLNDSYRALVFDRRMPDMLNFTKQNG